MKTSNKGSTPVRVYDDNTMYVQTVVKIQSSMVNLQHFNFRRKSASRAAARLFLGATVDS